MNLSGTAMKPPHAWTPGECRDLLKVTVAVRLVPAQPAPDPDSKRLEDRLGVVLGLDAQPAGFQGCVEVAGGQTRWTAYTPRVEAEAEAYIAAAELAKDLLSRARGA